MPSFDFYVEEDISVDDFYNGMTKSEKQEMLELLMEDAVYEEAKANPATEIFQESLDKIKANMLMLSLDQEEFLINLARSL